MPKRCELCWGCSLLDGYGGRARAVEVHVLPLAVAPVPHARLLGLHGLWHAAAVHVLRQADVGDACRVLAHQVHVRVQDDRVDRLGAFGQSYHTHTHTGVHTGEITFALGKPKELMPIRFTKKKISGLADTNSSLG